MWNWNKRLEVIEKKIDKLEDKFVKDLDWKSSIDTHLAVYNEQLKIHIEGVHEIKRQNELLEGYITKETQIIRKELEPIKAHIIVINTMIKYTKILILPVLFSIIGYALKHFFL
jgi:hypothetical protein